MTDSLPVSSWLKFLLVAAAAACAAPAHGGDRPNLIFIVADDLGYGDIGCFGSDKIRTPNIDRLATEGTRFTDFYGGAAVCAPSRSVLMTGLHTGHTRIRGNNSRKGQLESFAGGREGGRRVSLSAKDTTVAEVLQEAGYATGAAGKWGLGEPGTEGTPTRRGFDEWLGYLNQNHATYYYTDYLDEDEGIRKIAANEGGRRGEYSNDLFSDFAIRFVQRHRGDPFFLYLPYTIPHERMEVPDLGEYAAEDWPEDAKIYAAMVTRLDGYVGRLMAELGRLGLSEKTLVIFTSDNGPVKGARAKFFNSAGGFRGHKGTLNEGGLRVPLIVRWPGVVPAGRTSDVPWYFADILPTFAALGGAAPLPRPDGIDMSPTLRGESQAGLSLRPLYWESPQDKLWQAARLGEWKGIRYGSDQPLELYDLKVDKTESRNVAAENPGTVAAIERFLDSAHEPTPFWPVN
jgi:arylsulfatase A-like enzyme